MSSGGDLERLQREAEALGRQCVVGALILNDAGRVFVHRRGPDRAFLPGAWDVVGGHVEPGERLLDALAREVEEETGWRVAGEPRLIHVVDWDEVRGDPSTARREFDFVVEVAGDLGAPRLEWPKQVEWRWFGRHDLALLDENRGADEGIVRQIVEIALEHAR